MVVASLALAVAMGGTGYAAIKLPANSVGTKQLKKDAVTGVKVKDASLFANDFAPGQIPKGAVGATGATGAQGPPGVAGAPGVDGPAGAAGSAIAYARVATGGGVSDSKNIVSGGRGADPGNPAIKVYCLINTAGGAANVQVTVDAGSTDPLFAKLAVRNDPGSIAFYGCPAGTDFIVSSDSTAGAGTRGVDAAFFVAVIA